MALCAPHHAPGRPSLDGTTLGRCLPPFVRSMPPPRSNLPGPPSRPHLLAGAILEAFPRAPAVISAEPRTLFSPCVEGVPCLSLVWGLVCPPSLNW